MVGFCLEKCEYLQNIYWCGSYTFFAWLEDNYDMNDVTHHSFFCRGFFEKLIELRWVKSSSLGLSLGFLESLDEFVLLVQFWWLDKPIQFKMIQRSSFYGLKVQFVWGTLVRMSLKFIIVGLKSIVQQWFA